VASAKRLGFWRLLYSADVLRFFEQTDPTYDDASCPFPPKLKMPESPGKLFTCAIMTLRFTLAMWVGAAVLYVVTSVAEQMSPHFDLQVRDQLALIRFPLYYRFGFGCHIAAAIAGVLAWRTAPANRRATFLLVLVLVMVSGLLITLDHRIVYQPLEALITPAGKPRGDEFERLHHLSKRANMVHVMVMAFAGILAMLPLKPAQSTAE